MIDWQLSIAYFIHLLATVVWVGGIVLSALVVWPAVSRVLDDPEGKLLLEWQRRFSPLALLSLVALTVTGLMQMSANPNYAGLLQLSNIWSIAIFVKHIAFLVMVGVTAYSAWGIYPQMTRLALLMTKGKGKADFAQLRGRHMRLNQLNLICAVLVLAFTALARVA